MNHIELRVVTVTNNPEAYPEHAAASIRHPWLIPYIEDEVETFVVDPHEEGGFWGADEFFACVNVTHFTVDPRELK
ncbi:MAG: hypothetical protein ABFC88_12635 [Thermoguttaceae bacterium]